MPSRREQADDALETRIDALELERYDPRQASESECTGRAADEFWSDAQQDSADRLYAAIRAGRRG